MAIFPWFWNEQLSVLFHALFPQFVTPFSTSEPLLFPFLDSPRAAGLLIWTGAKVILQVPKPKGISLYPYIPQPTRAPLFIHQATLVKKKIP